jgi:hypothetical protein
MRDLEAPGGEPRVTALALSRPRPAPIRLAMLAAELTLELAVCAAVCAAVSAAVWAVLVWGARRAGCERHGSRLCGWASW